MEKKRLLYIDNIRLLVIVLVVALHISLTYNGYARWNYIEYAQLNFAESLGFAGFGAYLQSFSMGLLFLIAGFFTPGAYDRKGFKKFVRDRAVRLGIPSLLFVFLLVPVTENLVLGKTFPGQDFLSYWVQYVSTGEFLGANGALWFCIALLVFSLVYALVRFAIKNRPAPGWAINPGAKNLFILVLAITGSAFLIRLWMPIGTHFYNFMICNFAQYLILFPLGILAYRQDLFAKLKNMLGLKLPYWILICFLGYLALWLCSSFIGPQGYAEYYGGLKWQSALYAFWESFTAIVTDVGFLVLFRDRFNRQGRLTKSLSDGAFAVYVFHTPIIIWIAYTFRAVHWSPGLKFLFVTPICLAACFAAAWALRKVPLLKKVL